MRILKKTSRFTESAFRILSLEQDEKNTNKKSIYCHNRQVQEKSQLTVTVQHPSLGKQS